MAAPTQQTSLSSDSLSFLDSGYRHPDASASKEQALYATPADQL